MWALIAHFVHGTFSQVRCGSDLSEPWQDSGIAQGRVLSPLLFNILVDGLARVVHDACPGVSLMGSWDSRFAGQLYADDLVVVADSAADLQTGLDAVSAWGFRSLWFPSTSILEWYSLPHCLGQLTSSMW